jgi:multimeric flavodoxin WrbA/putative sterol carrier protein
MKILFVLGNPRKSGYTQSVAGHVLEGMRDVGAEVDVLDLASVDISACVGCYSCWLATPGQCVHRDDMGGILERLYACDLLFLATPVYYYAMSSLLKTFLERTLPLTSPGITMTPLGVTRNHTRDPERWHGKALAYLAVSALEGGRNLNGVQETFRLTANGLAMELRGELLRPESYLLEFSLAKPRTIGTITAALRSAGRELGAGQTVAAETARGVASSLTPGLEHFVKYSAYYWENAVALGSHATDLASVQSRTARDVRILMSEMARCADRTATARLNLDILFSFTDIGWQCTLHVDHGTCECREGAPAAAPALTITTTTTTWAALFTGGLDVRQAVLQREIVLAGDRSLFLRFHRLFPPPTD